MLHLHGPHVGVALVAADGKVGGGVLSDHRDSIDLRSWCPASFLCWAFVQFPILILSETHYLLFIENVYLHLCVQDVLRVGLADVGLVQDRHAAAVRIAVGVGAVSLSSGRGRELFLVAGR